MVYHCYSSLGHVDQQLAEFCCSPIIQSHSTTPGYDLKFTAELMSDPITHKGVLLVVVGMQNISIRATVPMLARPLSSTQ